MLTIAAPLAARDHRPGHGLRQKEGAAVEVEVSVVILLRVLEEGLRQEDAGAVHEAGEVGELVRHPGSEGAHGRRVRDVQYVDVDAPNLRELPLRGVELGALAAEQDDGAAVFEQQAGSRLAHAAGAADEQGPGPILGVHDCRPSGWSVKCSTSIRLSQVEAAVCVA